MFNAIIAETSGGVYGFLGSDDHFLYYWDLSLNEAVKVCGKPDCSHADKNCNAYFEYPIADLTIYLNGLLYVWDYEPGNVPTATLYCMEPDGSNRRSISSFFPADGRHGAPNFGVYSETDCFVVSSHGQNRYGYVQDGVYRVSLTDQGEAPQLIYFPDATDKMPQQSVEPIGVSDGRFYFKVSRHGDDVSETSLYCYDPQEESLEEIYTTDYAGAIFATIHKNTVYLVENPSYFDFDNAILYRMDLKTGEKQKIAEDGGFLTCDNSYLYVINGGIHIYDFKGNFICQMEPEFKDEVSECYSYTTRKYIYFRGNSLKDGSFLYQLIDKSGIKKNECETYEILIP